MMNYQEKDLKSVLADVLSVEISSVGEDTSIDTVESWDSLKHLTLVLALEEKFGISFTEEETVEILNYKLIKMTLEKHGIKFVG